jgi:hypothetical protein
MFAAHRWIVLAMGGLALLLVPKAVAAPKPRQQQRPINYLDPEMKSRVIQLAQRATEIDPKLGRLVQHALRLGTVARFSEGWKVSEASLGAPFIVPSRDTAITFQKHVGYRHREKRLESYFQVAETAPGVVSLIAKRYGKYDAVTGSRPIASMVINIDQKMKTASVSIEDQKLAKRTGPKSQAMAYSRYFEFGQPYQNVERASRTVTTTKRIPSPRSDF